MHSMAIVLVINKVDLCCVFAQRMRYSNINNYDDIFRRTEAKIMLFQINKCMRAQGIMTTHAYIISV